MTVVALIVAGCAEMKPVEDAVEPVTPATVEEPAPADASAPPFDADPALEGSASGDNLYKLLVAEIAGRRGRLDLALEYYLEVARETRDPAVAERAVRIAVFARDQEGGLEAANLWTEIAPDRARSSR